MKSNNNKVASQFSTKLSNIMTKFKDNSTVQVGHQQLKNLFGQFIFKDIFNSFISKMDNSDQLNERQKKQFGKIYITFIDCYKDKILFDQYFDKLMESLNKKQFGVSQVVGHISKTILNRIQNPQNLYPYISNIINIFHHHIDIAKILKQIIDSTAPILIKQMQSQILGIILQKINSTKNKSQFLDVILSLVVYLQQNLTIQSQVVNIIIKYLKHEDWNCRKMCVDISYAMLVINKEISSTIHNILKELKYDKIKHVRDSVNNYEQLYKQVFGDEIIPKINTVISKKRQHNNSLSQNKNLHKSPIQLSQKQGNPTRDKSNSIDKSVKKQKNQNFFKNAKDSDVIRIHQQNKSMIEMKNQTQEVKDINLSSVCREITFKLQESSLKQSPKNFQSYLKDRTSPGAKQKKSPLIKSYSPKNKPVQSLRNDRMKRESEVQSKKVTKFNYESQLQQFKKKNRVNEVQLTKIVKQEQNSLEVQQSFQKNKPEIYISQLSARTQTNEIQQIKNLFLDFSTKMFEKMDKMQQRIQFLQKQRFDSNSFSQKFPSFQPIDMKSIYQSQKSNQTHKGLQFNQRVMNSESSHRLQSPRSAYLNESVNESKWQNSDFQGIQSNLQQKVRISMMNENWDEAFTIALTNNKKNIILNLFEKCVFPRDKTVQQCILLEIKKLLNYISTLKWLKYFLMQRQMNVSRLHKLKEELVRKGTSDNRNYEMMKQLLLNQIQEQLKKSHLQS